MVLKEAILKYLEQFDDVRAGELQAEAKNGQAQAQMQAYYRGEKIFLIMHPETQPLRIEIRCDRRLSKTLQARYESVMAGRALGRNGTEIICSGQLSDDEIIDLVRHSYEMSAE